MNLKNKNLLLIIGIIALTAASIVYLYYFPINLGLDLQGGMRLVLQAEDTEKVKATEESVSGALAVIRSRIDALGVAEPIIQRKGLRQIIVELPGIKDPERAIKIVGDTALLEFVEAEWAPGDEKMLTPERIEILAGKGARLAKVPHFEDGRVISETPIILKQTVLEGKDLKGAWPSSDEIGGPVVSIEFTPDGTRTFAEVTTRGVGKPIAILLDGKIISAPNVKEPIPSGKAQISGNFSIEEVKDLVIKLRAGALPIPVQIIENRIVGPTLGRDSIQKSKFAGILGFTIVIVFMIIYYRLPGFLADIALIVYSSLVLAALSLIHATLTLPGIAGFILSIGMAVDANILIFERLKEEKRLGKPIIMAIESGFAHAFSAILDSNVTTIIAAICLFWLGTGTIRGFAVTLCVGILISMFTAIMVTRVFLESAAEAGLFDK